MHQHRYLWGGGLHPRTLTALGELECTALHTQVRYSIQVAVGMSAIILPLNSRPFNSLR